MCYSGRSLSEEKSRAVQSSSNRRHDASFPKFWWMAENVFFEIHIYVDYKFEKQSAKKRDASWTVCSRKQIELFLERKQSVCELHLEIMMSIWTLPNKPREISECFERMSSWGAPLPERVKFRIFINFWFSLSWVFWMNWIWNCRRFPIIRQSKSMKFWVDP